MAFIWIAPRRTVVVAFVIFTTVATGLACASLILFFRRLICINIVQSCCETATTTVSNDNNSNNEKPAAGHISSMCVCFFLRYCCSCALLFKWAKRKREKWNWVYEQNEQIQIWSINASGISIWPLCVCRSPVDASTRAVLILLIAANFHSTGKRKPFFYSDDGSFATGWKIATDYTRNTRKSWPSKICLAPNYYRNHSYVRFQTILFQFIFTWIGMSSGFFLSVCAMIRSICFYFSVLVFSLRTFFFSLWSPSHQFPFSSVRNICGSCLHSAEKSPIDFQNKFTCAMQTFDTAK